jgi:nucleoside-diphosphate-sugar epimerase
MRVALTGAAGFIGRVVCRRLYNEGYDVRAVVRSLPSAAVSSHEVCCIGEIGPDTRWDDTLAGVDVVVHLAARAHILHERTRDPEREYWRTNVAGTERLARAAMGCGVRRFIYVSSIGVVGNQTPLQPFSESDPPQPHDVYTRSKYEAECRLHEARASGHMELVIIRPPLVYGPGVPGNFALLLKAVHARLPLPVKSVYNRRSYIYSDNLADFIMRCMEHPQAMNEIFVVSDGEDISTPELVTRIARAMGRTPMLLPCNIRLMKAVAKVIGKSDLFIKLCGSLCVNSQKACKLMNWAPPFSLDAGLNKTVSWYLDHS